MPEGREQESLRFEFFLKLSANIFRSKEGWGRHGKRRSLLNVPVMQKGEVLKMPFKLCEKLAKSSRGHSEDTADKMRGYATKYTTKYVNKTGKMKLSRVDPHFVGLGSRRIL